MEYLVKDIKGVVCVEKVYNCPSLLYYMKKKSLDLDKKAKERYQRFIKKLWYLALFMFGAIALFFLFLFWLASRY